MAGTRSTNEPPPWDEFSTLSAEYSFEFNFLIDYLWKMEGSLDFLRKEEERKLENMVPEHRKFREAFESHKLDWVFPTSLRYSFLTLLFTHLEAKLRYICDNLAVRDELGIKERDLRGGVVSRAKRYLHHFAQVPRDNSLWNRANEVSKVRNCIVHTGGRINLSRDQRFLEQLAHDADDLAVAPEAKSGDRYLMVGQRYPMLMARDLRDQMVSVLNSVADPSEWDECD